MLRSILLGAATLAAVSLGSAAQATQFVTNGSFETTSLAASYKMNTTNVTGWSTTGYNFLFFPGTATTTGAYVPEYKSQITLWGGNGFPASSPDGGNFIAADGAFGTAPITQTISGLTKGAKYNVSFDWAAAQQSGFSGVTTEQWQVSLGAATHSTAVKTNPNHGFTGWFSAVFTYTATGSSEVLSFLAQGTPQGQPPFSLLDGVSMTAVPEPGSWTLLLLGLFAVGGTVWLRSRSAGLNFAE